MANQKNGKTKSTALFAFIMGVISSVVFGLAVIYAGDHLGGVFGDASYTVGMLAIVLGTLFSWIIFWTLRVLADQRGQLPAQAAPLQVQNDAMQAQLNRIETKQDMMASLAAVDAYIAGEPAAEAPAAEIGAPSLDQPAAALLNYALKYETDKGLAHYLAFTANALRSEGMTAKADLISLAAEASDPRSATKLLVSHLK